MKSFIIKYSLVILFFIPSMIFPSVTSDPILQWKKYKKHYKWMTSEKFTAIYSASQIYKISVDEICAIIESESDGYPKAISCVGARGLMQVMPQYHYKGNPDDLYNVNLNVMLGTKIWKRFKEMAKNDMKLSIIYYNGGPAYPVKKYTNWKYLNTIIANNTYTKKLKDEEIIIR